jgi:hypothetical protein
MELTERELYTVLHGLVLGTLFLLAFGGGLAGLWSLRERYLTAEGLQERSPRLFIGTSVMAIVAWLTVFTGTFIAYPWYRATPPEGVDRADPAALEAFPDSSSSPRRRPRSGTSSGWSGRARRLAAPFLATAVAFAVLYYGAQLVRRMRSARR